MAQIVFTNFATSTLANPFGPSDTSVTLAAGTGSLYPSPTSGDYFALTVTDAATALNHEILYVYGRSGDVLNPVVRAQEGTSAQSWIVGDTAQNNHTAGVMGAFAQKDSPVLVGTPTAPTPSPRDNSTKIATTAYADLAASSIPGLRSNLVISATGVDASIAVSFNYATLSNSSGVMYLAASGSLSINTATVGANGLDTGSLAGGTWYSVWAIFNGTTVSGLISLSATSPTLPSGYTYKARIGWIRTDGTANRYPLGFMQKGSATQYKVAAGSNVANLPIMASGLAGNTITPTWAAISVSDFVPPTASAIFISMALSAGGTAQIMAAPNNAYGAYFSLTNPPPVAFSQSGAYATIIEQAKFVLESTNIYWACSASGAIACLGWEDNL